MGFFHLPKPRHFHHEPIYFDEHKDRVKQIEKRARQELKVKESHGFDAGNIRGAFTRDAAKKRARRRSLITSVLQANTGAMIVIIIALILIWIYLQK